MLTVVAVILLLLIALLAIPVTLSFQVSWKEVFQKEVEILWAFGLVHARIPLDQAKSEPQKSAIDNETIERIDKQSRNKNKFFAIFWQIKLRKRIFKFISDLWLSAQKENLRLRICIGLGDPADTGQLWAIIGPIAGILSNVQTASIEIEADFLETVLEFDGNGKIRIIPLQIIYLTIALLLSPQLWQGIRQLRTAGQ